MAIQTNKLRQFYFSEKDFFTKVDWKSWSKSNFDKLLEETWCSKEDLFRYKLSINETKFLDGNLEFLAQLNINRAVNRRPPEDIRSINKPFSADEFNFTKVRFDEVMFTLIEEGSSTLEDDERDYFLINVSPMEKIHSLLLPSLYKCIPQILNEQSIYLALQTVLLSSSPEMRVGFNSLCGFATVNHLHLHSYYLNVPMKLETIKVEHLAGSCYVLEHYPSQGYVFQLTSPSDMPTIVKHIYLLTSYLTSENIAHNLYFTRGLSFEKSAHGVLTTERDCIRIYVWGRTSSFGAKELEAFNPALCELFGHLIIKSKEAYDRLDEESVATILRSITSGPFSSTKEKVKEMFLKEK